MDELLALIARNPSISKRTSSKDIDLIDKYHKQVFKVHIADKGCYTCVLGAFDKLRAHVGYEPLIRKELKNITKQRLEKCYTCEYLVKDGFNLFGVKKDTCGRFLNKTRTNPDKTDEGVELCGCIVTEKAALRRRLLKVLGGCPAEKWDI